MQAWRGEVDGYDSIAQGKQLVRKRLGRKKKMHYNYNTRMEEK